MKKYITVYIHTIDGRPGTFDGNQICFTTFYGAPNNLCLSLDEINRQRKASRKFRASLGFDDDTGYGYFRFRVPIAALREGDNE